MSDARLQALYRRLAATRDATHCVDADAILDVLQRHGYPDEEGTSLDRVAASAAEADVLRVALALTPDAVALSREVAAFQSSTAVASQRPRAPARRWMALAASVGALAVLFAMLRGGPVPQPAPIESLPSERIFSVSFESVPTEGTERVQTGPIFRGDFDS